MSHKVEVEVGSGPCSAGIGVQYMWHMCCELYLEPDLTTYVHNLLPCSWSAVATAESMT